MTALADTARGIADAALEGSVVGSFSRVGIRARRALFSWDREPEPDLAGRVALVTGATGGIGFAAARELAARHAHVWLVGRNPARTQQAKAQILAAVPNARLSIAEADLGSLDDVRRSAETIAAETDHLDVLVHNAGALARELQLTRDGNEITAQVHVVAPFLLTEPVIDFTTMANSMGVPGTRVEKPNQVGPAIRRMLDTDGPFLIDLVITNRVPGAK